MARRTLDEVIRFMVGRIAALSAIMADRRDWSYAGQAIKELADSLGRMPLSEEETTVLRVALEPLVVRHGQLDRSGGALNHWMEPVLNLLSEVPKPTTSVATEPV